MKIRFLKKTGCILIAALLSGISSLALAEEKKPPITQYWMNVSTQNMSIPGMSSEEMSGLEGMMMGRMAGMGPKRGLMLQLNSPRPVPAVPEATHDIPPGQKMGSTLPLLIPERTKPVKEEEGEEAKYEKPKMRMLMYWGCSETVRQGQPKVLDTEKMSMIDFGKAMSGKRGSAQNPPSQRTGWAYSEWPNRNNQKEIPKGSSLQGNHFIHGNYSPDIKFAVDENHDFMAPVEFSSVKGGLADSIKFQWKKIPTALGYFAMAMGHNEKTGEMIIWSSSEPQEPGYGLMNYLSPADVNRFIKEKVVMGPEVTSCSIPQGIFKESKGAAVQFIAYGDELNIAWPPKPKDPKVPHDYIWAMKLRNKSTGMLPLGQEDSRQERRTRGRQEQEQDEQPADTERSEERPRRGKGGLMRGILGF
ncbi:MAG: hypothetical protein HZA15_14265 [Nitrospirae bacterium]|nr:hypothetical protein [Nitrospirota bacterium]